MDTETKARMVEEGKLGGDFLRTIILGKPKAGSNR